MFLSMKNLIILISSIIKNITITNRFLSSDNIEKPDVFLKIENFMIRDIYRKNMEYLQQISVHRYVLANTNIYLKFHGSSSSQEQYGTRSTAQEYE